MILDLEPGTLLWKWYCYYLLLGGNAHQPEYETVGRFVRKLILWTPFRWFLYSKIVSVPVALWIGLVLWSFVDLWFVSRVAILGILWLLFEDARDYARVLIAHYDSRVVLPTNRILIKLK